MRHFAMGDKSLVTANSPSVLLSIQEMKNGATFRAVYSQIELKNEAGNVKQKIPRRLGWARVWPDILFIDTRNAFKRARQSLNAGLHRVR